MRYIALAIVLAALPALSLAADAGDSYISEVNYTLEQPFGGESTVSSFGEYLQLVYQFALGIVGIIAVVLIMLGGLRWIAAAGNESAIGEAKEIIISAVTGLVIALLSYTILFFINPQTTKVSMNILRIPVTLDDFEITSLPKCTESSFSGKTCLVSGTTGSAPCETLTCNDIGDLDGKYCRGVSCETGACDRGPTDPSQYSCQNYFCGLHAQTCADSGYKTMPSASLSFESAYHECTCTYYEQPEPLKNLGITTLAVDDLTDSQEAIFAGLCNETTPQDVLAADIGANPGDYGFLYGATAAQLKGWNCGFSCSAGTAYHIASSSELNCTPK